MDMNIEELRNVSIKLCKDAKNESYSEWEKIVKESYPKGIADDLLRSWSDGLERGDVILLLAIKDQITMLSLAKSNPKEAQKFYKDLKISVDERLTYHNILKHSNYAEVFTPYIIEDMKSEYSFLSEDDFNKLIELSFKYSNSMQGEKEPESME